jgi:hypothetical protein
MRRHLAWRFLGVIVLCGSSVLAGENLQSGPLVGKNVPGAFHPLNVTGAYAGKKQCLVSLYGPNPVVMVFAREANDAVTSLIKTIDAETEKNGAKKLASFVVFLSSDVKKQQTEFKALADKEGVKKTILAIDDVAGPKLYKLAKEAEVTVILYEHWKVVSNFAFKKGELDAAAIDKIAGDVPKILTK